MRGTPFLKEGFSGGLNTISDPYLVDEKECRDCLNVVSTERGSIKKRFGSTLFSVSPPNTEWLSLAAVNISGTRYLIAADATKLYSVTEAGAIATIGEGFTAGRWSIVQAPKSHEVASEGPVYLSNGKDKAQFWTGAEAKTAVAEWKGVASAPELSDGILKEGQVTLTSKTAQFIASDIGQVVTIKTAVKQKSGGTEIKTARILTRPSPEEVTLEINPEGWEKTYESVKFKLERPYYETSPNVPQGKYMIWAGNRIWMTGVEADQSAVFFSGIVPIGAGGEEGDPSSWPKANVVRFDASDGKPITGIGTVGPYILVFKESKTWVIHDINTGANRKIADKIGCVAQRSIVETAGGTFFLTADQGVYHTNGSTVTEMSYNVRPTILGINPAQREFAAGEYWNNHYYLSFAKGTSATSNRTLDYDSVLKSWWLHDLTGNQWARFEATTGEPHLYCIPPKAKAGVVQAFVEGTYQDSGKNYTGNEVLGAFWLGAWEPFAYYIFRHRIKAPFLKKRVRQIFFNGEGQIIPGVYKNFQIGERQEKAVPGSKPETEPELPVNFEPSTTKWAEGEGIWGTGEGIWGGEATVGQARIYAPGIANVWSVGFGNNSAEPFTVEAFAYMIQFRKS
jgi:hypothetical protein